MSIIFDIETKPVPALVDRFTKPFPSFDPGAVKFGNTKDPEKRLQIVKDAEASHVTEQAAYWEKARSRAALNPLTGQVVVIGMMVDRQRLDIVAETEKAMLEEFWLRFSNPHHHAEPFVFWSGSGNPTENFDPEYLIKRSWVLGVAVPPTAFGDRGYMGRRVVDAAQRYLMGKREAFCSLSDCADQLGLYDVEPCHITRKNKQTDLVTGENFHLWFDGKMPVHPEDGTGAAAATPESQRAMALRYLGNDLLMLAQIAERVL